MHHPRHLADGRLGLVEVVDRPFADHRVETGIGEREPVGPGLDPSRLWGRRTGALEPHPAEHAARRLRPHDPSAASGKGLCVLTEATRHIKDTPPGASLGQGQRSLRHTIKEVLGVARRPGRDDVAHIPVEV